MALYILNKLWYKSPVIEWRIIMKNKTSICKVAGLIVLIAGCGLLLAACGFLAPGEIKICPRVSLLNKAEKMVRYRDGPGRDLTDIRYEAKVLDIKSSCKYLDNRVQVEAVIDIVAQKGPASKGVRIQVPFFVAIIDSGQNIIAKKTFASELEFLDRSRRAGVREEIEQIMYLKKGEAGAGYEIIVGLQLTKDQLKQNRGQ